MKITTTQIECMYEAADSLSRMALEEIEDLYGAGGRFPQKYHNLEHTRDVINATQAIGLFALEKDKIQPIDIPLLIVASAWHDRYYDPRNKGENEIKSAGLAVKEMQRYTCFEPEHYKAVTEIILATTVSSFFPRIVQNVDPTDYRTGIIADADLSSFGMPFDGFKPRAFAYLGELVETNQQRLMQYLDGECVLLTNHRWHTPEASELFPHAMDNVVAIRGLQSVYAIQ